MRSSFIVEHTLAPILAVLLILAPPPCAAQARPDEPAMEEIPDACSYLEESTARALLRVDQVRAGAANEHIPTFWSQCTYSGQGVRGRQVGFVFKFMVWDLFDTGSRDPVELNFNAQFAGGGVPPSATMDDPGKISFAFQDRDRSTLMMVTGIQGPADGAGRPSALVASYYLADPERPHAEKLQALLDLARRHLEEWLASAGRN
jgi:hypothetical protein